MAAFANPVLALGPMAVGAVQLRMLSEMASVYDVPLSAEFIEKVGHQMAQTLLKLGVAEAAVSVLGGLIKFNPVGFAAGGIVQAVTMAYLTRLTGQTFAEYLEHGGTWGESGMQGELSRQLEETRRSEWLLQFAKMAIQAPVPPLGEHELKRRFWPGRKESRVARLDITMEHGQPPKIAKAKFKAAIHEAQTRFRDWFERIEWTDDDESATFTGSGVQVRCWFDERYVHVQGSIPLWVKLLEGAIRSQIEHDIHRQLPAHHAT